MVNTKGFLGFMVVFPNNGERQELDFTVGEVETAESMARQYGHERGWAVLVGFRFNKFGKTGKKHGGAVVIATFKRAVVGKRKVA